MGAGKLEADPESRLRRERMASAASAPFRTDAARAFPRFEAAAETATTTPALPLLPVFDADSHGERRLRLAGGGPGLGGVGGGAVEGDHNYVGQHEWTDPVLGLSLHGNERWYSSRDGVWIQPDRLGDVDSISLYAFVGQQPHEKTDPLGSILPQGVFTRSTSYPPGCPAR